MDIINQTNFHPVLSILIGIPGFKKLQFFIFIPFGSVYVVALVGTSLLTILIWLEHSLHGFMYLFLAMLAMTDFLLSNTIMAKMLALFWVQTESISFQACLTQIFFVIFIFIKESMVLFPMAFDRYVAICFPLRHTMILTHSVIRNLGAFSLVRAWPSPFLLSSFDQLPFCGNNITTYVGCAQTKDCRLTYVDITANNICTLVMSFLSTGLDVLLIFISYVLFFLLAVFQFLSHDAQLKALGTCSSHVCLIFMFYLPVYMRVLAIHLECGILLANLYVVVPSTLNHIIYCVKSIQIQNIVTSRISKLGLGFGADVF